MANAAVSSAALSELGNDLTQLSATLHEIFELMNADMRQVNAAWQDDKYEQFVQGYRPQINKCEEISMRYRDWCTKVLAPEYERVVEIEKTDVSGGSAGGYTSGVGDASAVAATAALSASTGIGNKFNMRRANNAQNHTTKAEPISNGCGSETSPTSFGLAWMGRQWDSKRTAMKNPKEFSSAWDFHGKSCDAHDKCYYNGEGKEKCDNEFQDRSRVMGTAVKWADETSTKSYAEAQQDRKISQQLQSTWENENQQSLDAENYRVRSRNEQDDVNDHLRENGIQGVFDILNSK